MILPLQNNQFRFVEWGYFAMFCAYLFCFCLFFVLSILDYVTSLTLPALLCLFTFLPPSTCRTFYILLRCLALEGLSFYNRPRRVLLSKHGCLSCKFMVWFIKCNHQRFSGDGGFKCLCCVYVASRLPSSETAQLGSFRLGYSITSFVSCVGVGVCVCDTCLVSFPSHPPMMFYKKKICLSLWV